MINAAILALLCGVGLGLLALSFLVLWRARTAVRAAKNAAEAARQQNEEALQAIRDRIEALCGQINDLRREPVAASGTVRPGINLSKRSQALRMHRRGDSPEQIAAALEVPLQELELLVKVHRIVMNNL